MTGDQLRASRASFGLSQKSAADLLSVHWRTFQNWECGVSDMPRNMAELWQYKTIGLKTCNKL
jgi:DNA-binding transcriptional regulator YiaG